MSEPNEEVAEELLSELSKLMDQGVELQHHLVVFAQKIYRVGASTGMTDDQKASAVVRAVSITHSSIMSLFSDS